MHSTDRWSTRSDAWTPQDDERLATLVLEHIRTGSTQLRAFDQAAGELVRTTAACGYRWNGVVRKEYRNDIEQAKRERKSRQKSAAIRSGELEYEAITVTSSESMQDVIRFLQTYDEQYQKLRLQLHHAEGDKRQLSTRVQELEDQVAGSASSQVTPVTPEQLASDSKTLFAIMQRARKLLEDDKNHVSE